MRAVKYDMAYLSQYSTSWYCRSKTKRYCITYWKKRRKEFLNDIPPKKTALKNNKKYEGKIVEVLIENIENGIVTGKTRNIFFSRIEFVNSDVGQYHLSVSGLQVDGK